MTEKVIFFSFQTTVEDKRRKCEQKIIPGLPNSRGMKDDAKK